MLLRKLELLVLPPAVVSIQQPIGLIRQETNRNCVRSSVKLIFVGDALLTGVKLKTFLVFAYSTFKK